MCKDLLKSFKEDFQYFKNAKLTTFEKLVVLKEFAKIPVGTLVLYLYSWKMGNRYSLKSCIKISKGFALVNSELKYNFAKEFLTNDSDILLHKD